MRSKREDSGPRTSGTGKSSPEKDLRMAEKLLAILHPIKVSWLESIVLLHYYWQYLSLPTVADIAGRHIIEIVKARDSLLTKVAVTAGYVDADQVGIKVEIAPTKEEKVRQLRGQGLEWKDVGAQMGISAEAARWIGRKIGISGRNDMRK